MMHFNDYEDKACGIQVSLSPLEIREIVIKFLWPIFFPKFNIDQACSVFLESPGNKDPKDNGLRCQTCKYTNTKTNTSMQIHKVGLNTVGPQYTLGILLRV